MVAHPGAARQLFRETVHGYLGDDPTAEYEADIKAGRERIQNVMADHGIDGNCIDAVVDDLRE